jgi:hypothetical protein
MACVYPRAGWGEAAAVMSVAAACIRWSHLRSILVVGVGFGIGYRDLLADAGVIWTRRGGLKAATLSPFLLNTLA